VEQTKIPVGSEPRSIVVDQAGRRAFAFSALAGTVSVIEISARGVIRAIPTEPTPVRGSFNRRGDRLYVIHETAPFMTVINPATLSITGRFPIRSGMAAIKADPNTDLVYLAPRGDLLVGVHEPFSFAPLAFLDTGAAVTHMATDAEENTLYLASPETNRVLVYHRIRRSPAGILDVGDGPAWISVMGEN
jgi:DNA-binding beta-propeller fold protein YncE